MIQAGQEVDYTVTWLEMRERPRWAWPQLPSGPPASLLCADAPPPWYFLALYAAVGRDYAWEDMFQRPEAELAGWLAAPGVTLHSLMREGWPAGLFLLDAQEAGRVDLAYFGLVPEAIGAGLGTFLLRSAILAAWETEGIEMLTVNTCTLDHPRALGLYQRNGFRPVRREARRRTLKRAIPRDPTC